MPAVSFTGSQAGIVTDTEHGKAKIIEVKGDRIREALAAGKVAIVAGLPGHLDRRATSPRSAAAAPTPPRSRSPPRSAPRCARSTPTSKACTPPTRASCPQARKLARVSFDEMLEMAATGGRVLALRSVEFARNHHVQVHVRSSFTWAPGTWVTEEDPSLTSMEQAIISGVTHDTSEAKVTIEQVPDRPGVAATFFRDARRRGRQRRHDRAERVDRGPHRHLVHRAARRPRRAPRGAWRRSSSTPRRAAIAPTRTSAGSRSSARA